MWYSHGVHAINIKNNPENSANLLPLVAFGDSCHKSWEHLRISNTHLCWRVTVLQCSPTSPPDPPYPSCLSCPYSVVAVKLGLRSLTLVFILVDHLVPVLAALGPAVVGVLLDCGRKERKVSGEGGQVFLRSFCIMWLTGQPLNSPKNTLDSLVNFPCPYLVARYTYIIRSITKYN